MSDTQQRIDTLVKSSDVLLFMKGNASFPQCGFSGRAIQILKASGVDPKTLSGILGHTNASFTLDTYTHVTPDMQKTASGIVGGFMEDIFGKELKPWQESEKTETEL